MAGEGGSDGGKKRVFKIEDEENTPGQVVPEGEEYVSSSDDEAEDKGPKQDMHKVE